MTTTGAWPTMGELARSVRRSLVLHVALASGTVGWAAVARVGAWDTIDLERLTRTAPAFVTTAFLSAAVVALALRAGRWAPIAVVFLATAGGALNGPAYYLLSAVLGTEPGIGPDLITLTDLAMFSSLACIVSVPLGLAFGLGYVPFVWAASREEARASHETPARAGLVGATLLGCSGALVLAVSSARRTAEPWERGLAAVLLTIALAGLVEALVRLASARRRERALRAGTAPDVELVPIALASVCDAIAPIDGSTALLDAAVVARAPSSAYRGRPVALALASRAWRGAALPAEAAPPEPAMGTAR